jgi:DNA-binding GntR family transcriptional regulator
MSKNLNPSPDVGKERNVTVSVHRQAARPSSLRSQAYQEVKTRIISQQFRPGEYLNAAGICGLLHIGRTPVQQAIERLAIEGMLEVIPRKGVIVRPASFIEILQLSEARLVVEEACCSLAAQRATGQDIDEMQAILDEERRLETTDAIAAMIKTDREFHASIARAARNKVLADALSPIHDRSLRYWFISWSHRERWIEVEAQHKSILEAIKSRQADAARCAIRAHIESLRKAVASSI